MDKAIDDFELFLLVDLPSKIFPHDETLEKLKGEDWYREDYFKNKKEVEEYIKGHFKVLRTEIKNGDNYEN